MHASSRQLVVMLEQPAIAAAPRVYVQNVNPADRAGRNCNQLWATKSGCQLRKLNRISGRIQISVRPSERNFAWSDIECREDEAL
jgi:hypothetical protein